MAQDHLVSRQARIGTPARKKDPVFLNTLLAPLSTAALDHSVRGWFARAGVPLPPGAAAHAFRHTVAMQLIGLGESATVVQDLLGHASLSSTQVYTKPLAGTSAPPPTPCPSATSCILSPTAEVSTGR